MVGKARRTALHLLCQQDQTRTGTEYREARLNSRLQRLQQIQIAEQLPHDSALPSGEDQAVHRAVQIPELADLEVFLPQSVQHGTMLREGSLKR